MNWQVLLNEDISVSLLLLLAAQRIVSRESECNSYVGEQYSIQRDNTKLKIFKTKFNKIYTAIPPNSDMEYIGYDSKN